MEEFCRCGNSCIKPGFEVLRDYEEFYVTCSNCENTRLKKFRPLASQMDVSQLDADYKRCECGKRHLDVVMAHILKIMMDEGIKDEYSTLRDVCVPLITPAYPLEDVPHLPMDSMVILSDDVDKECAERILSEVPEVKGILKGDLKDTVGVKDSKSSPSTYKLLSGCDLRCDLVYTPWGTLCIYKYQGEIHIEFPKPLSPKIKVLKKVLSRYNKPKVLDCTCGPGTLGLAALSAGATRVVLNDVWPAACRNTVMNLEMNGYPATPTGADKGLVATGDKFEVYCLDVKDLKDVLDEKFDVCLVDVFPGVDTSDFIEPVKDICREVVII